VYKRRRNRLCPVSCSDEERSETVRKNTEEDAWEERKQMCRVKWNVEENSRARENEEQNSRTDQTYRTEKGR
jgi:hypothetical protein